MAHELADIVTQIDELRLTLENVEDRLARVESQLGGELPRRLPQQTAEPAVSEERSGPSFWAADLGRSLLIVGGAYFIRAATESQIVPQRVGFAVAIDYALFWVWLADRAASAGRGASAHFYTGAAAAIAFPLIFEGTTRFDATSPTVAALLLSLTSGGMLAVACRRSLPIAAWIAVLGASGTAIALFFTTQVFEPSALFLVVLGASVYWACRTRSWPGITGLTALAADFGVLVVGTGALTAGAQVDSRMTIAIQLLLFGVYTSSFLYASLRLGHRSGVFEGLQLLLVTLVGFGGAAWVAVDLGGRAPWIVAATSLAAAGAGYAALLANRRWIREHPRSYLFYATLTWVVCAVGGGLLPGPAAPAWLLLAVLAAVVATRLGGAMLELHAVASLWLAAFGAGLHTAVAFAFVISPRQDFPLTVSALDGAILLAALLCALLPVSTGREPWRPSLRFAKATLLALLLLGAGTACVALLLPLTEVGGVPDHGRLAALRTAVLATATLLAAAASRIRPLLPATWLVYPFLVAGGLKLLAEDLFHSRAGQLGLALALYASALILAPRLRAGTAPRGPTPKGAADPSELLP